MHPLLLQDIQYRVGSVVIRPIIKGQVSDSLITLPSPYLPLQLSQQPEALVLLLLYRLRQSLLLRGLGTQGLHLGGQSLILRRDRLQLLPHGVQPPTIRVGHPQAARHRRHHHQHRYQSRQQSAFLLFYFHFGFLP